MTRELTLAAVQLPDLRETFAADESNGSRRARNLAAAEAWLVRAGERGATIACLGESFTTNGLQLTAANFREEIEQGLDEVAARLGAIAQRYRMHLIAPVWAAVDGVPRNIAAVLDREGRYLGGYCKVHCTESERDLGIVPGDAWPVFDLNFGRTGRGRIGIQVCHDNSFPESARCLSMNGAEVIFWPHVMSGWGDEFMDVLLRGPAIYNGVYHVPVCYGRLPGRAWMPGMMIGRSSIIRPDGIFAADAGRSEGMAIATIDLDAPRIARDFTRHGDYVFRIDMLNDRRPETYEALVRPWEKRQIDGGRPTADR